MLHQKLQRCNSTPWVETVDPAVPSNDNQSLGYHEWAVVEMARGDGPRSANPDSLANRILRVLFGVAIPRALANSRLEGLRRFAVAAWFRSEIRPRHLRDLFAAGFNSNDAVRVLDHVSAARGSAPEVEAWP